jgi:hypothetical protein
MHWQGKFRGADFNPLTFRLHTVTHERLKNAKGKEIPTVIAKFSSEAEQEAIAQANRTDRATVLDEIIKDGKASVAQYAVRCGWYLHDGRPNKNRAHRVIKDLKKQKLITGEPGDYSVHDKKKEHAKGEKSRSENSTDDDPETNAVLMPRTRRTRDSEDDENDK